MINTNRNLLMGITILATGLFLFINTIVPNIVHADPGTHYTATTPQGSSDCSSWANACNLQTALDQAISGDEIWVQAGVHKPTSDPNDRTAVFALKTGVALYGGFSGDETNLEQRNWLANITILSGDIDSNDLNTDGNLIAETSADIQGSNAYHVVNGNYTNNTAVLDGFVITAGQANSTYPDDSGGGMYNQDASPQLTNLIFSGNTAVDGGGMFNFNSHPLVTDVTFTGNTSANNGGGMNNNWYSAPVLTRVTFDSNSATANGGGLANAGDNLKPVLQDVIFSKNSAGAGGGGLYNSVSNTTQEGKYTNVTFSGNTAAEGGGMHSNNITGPILTNGLFIENTATSGGAVYNYRSTIEFINTTFTNNTASSQGGAMYNWWQRAPLLKNTIVWGNSAPEGPEIYNGSLGDTIISYSDIQGCGGSGAGWDSACGSDNGGNIEVDPLFVDAGNGNLRLGQNSPAIDAGDNTAVPLSITTDLGGSPRFQDIPYVPDTGSGTPSIVDMGAYEADITAPTVISILRADPNPTNAVSLDFTVTFSEAVTGVDKTDFILTTTGDITGASLSQVNGGLTTYTVTVATGTSSGTLRLDLSAAATISDPTGNTLPGLPYTGGEAYTLDKTAPSVVSILRADPSPTSATSVDFNVTFSEGVITIDAGDFSLTASGSLTGAKVTQVSGTGVNYTVTVSTGKGGGSLRLDIPASAAITDLVGNSLGGLPYESGEPYAILYRLYLPLTIR